MTFSTLGLSETLHLKLKQEKYEKPFPVQKQVIPKVLEGKDVLGIAKTGSGKTASYVLPILSNFRKVQGLGNRHVQCLILVPTRELAIQVEEVVRTFAEGAPERIKSLAVFGGVSINPQMKSLQNVSILVATPGRLIDLIEHNAVQISSIETLVLDEADKMLNMGFEKEMNQLLEKLPKKRQNLLFSATLSKDLKELNRLVLNEPVVIEIEDGEDVLDTIDQLGYFVSEEEKGPLLRYIIKSEKMEQVLVFVSSTQKAEAVAHKMRKNGIDTETIHGKLSQSVRRETLDNFKRGKLRVLIATDLLSRGVDIEFLPCVINYELPRSPKDYVHRIGRTGRAESPGKAIALITPEEQHHFRVIQKKMKKWVTMIDSKNIELKGY